MMIYSVEIASTGALDEGFIDPKTTQDYVDFDGETGELADYTAKAKGYVRWKNMCVKLSTLKVASEVSEIIETGGAALTAPTALSFKIEYDEIPSLRLKDNTIEEGVDAVKTVLAEALSRDYTFLAMVWDPTTKTVGEKKLLPIGATFKYVSAPKLFATAEAAKAVITVAEDDEG